MKVVTYNIQFGLGQDRRFDLERVGRTVSDADIIALQEVERHWARTQGQDQPALLAALFPDHDWVYGAYFDGYGGKPGRRQQFGNMILSRWPILATRTIVLPMEARPAYNMRQGMLEALVDVPDGPIRFWNIHLGYLGEAERLHQLTAIEKILSTPESEQALWCGEGNIRDNDWTNGASPPAPARATILLGDFNSEPGSEVYRRITAPSPEGLGFNDSRIAWREDTPPTLTYADINGVEKPACLDYCFLPANIACLDYRVDTRVIASDHQPVWQELALLAE